MALQGFFGPDFQPNTIQRNNFHLSTEQNNITTAVTRPILQSQTSINNFVDRISSAEQDEFPAAILKRYQLSNYDRRISLKLPVKTCWGSSAICLNSLQVNQLAIELTITELSRNQTVRIEDDIKSIVLDDEFWEDVDNLLKVLNELVIGISMFESDTPSLSKVLDWYHNQLESPVYVFDVAGNNIKNIIEKRWKRIYHPVMEVVHLLDPSFHGRHLTSDSMNKISLFIQKYYSDNAVIIWTQILNYKEKNRVFANKLAWEIAGKIDPVTWWYGNFSDSAPELTQVAKKVLSILTSSAASERNWGNIDNKTQVLEESEESEDSDYEDEHLLNSSSESEEDNFNNSYHPNSSFGQYIYNILVYDIPAKWNNVELLEYLKVWGNIISVMVKKQKKYKTVKCKLEIMYAFSTWEKDRLWIALLGPITVRWFPAAWFFYECKEKEQFQAVIMNLPDTMTASALFLKENLTNFINSLCIKTFKEVKNLDELKKSGSSHSVATGSNHVPIRSPLKDSGKSSIRHKADEKTKMTKTRKRLSEGPSFPKKLSKKQLHAEIMKIKKVLLDFIQKQSQS
ncbi:uncharacterized protein LOC112597101 [Rhizophagus clarus]|uniref:Uncharacterized protein LOC112597101 n=1 Tax=Rhizophagus clarus TaxID=94130 RepID=A0A8H3QSV1_9GLOM|nr:uncharacterized protein LOC112597101 [Rhizophagus clarus]